MTQDTSTVLKALKALGPVKAERVLAVGWPETTDFAAVRAILKPRALTWIGLDPQTRAKGVTHQAVLQPVAKDEVAGFDLIVGGPGLGYGSLKTVRETVAGLARRLAPEGVALLALDTFASPPETGPTHDGLLFPALAQSGLLGDTARDRACLGPANWLLMLNSLGLEVQGVAGYGDSPVGGDIQAEHGPRLALFDEREIATPRLLVRAIRRKGSGR